MSHLLAKTKGRNGEFFKIFSDEEIFELPSDLDNTVEYRPDHNLDEDSWYAIEDFSEKDYCLEFLIRRFIAADFVQIATADYKSIDFFCSYQAGVYYFQKVAPKQLIRKKYFTLTDEPTFYDNAPIIIIDNYPDAIYVKVDDTLYFKNLSAITGIFRGIDILFREATQEETEQFLQSNFIQLGNDFSAAKVKKANRKRIALAMETLGTFSRRQKTQIFSYVREYCQDLHFDENAENFSVSSEDDLKKLLYGVEQRYYTTKIGNEKRLANSITTV